MECSENVAHHMLRASSTTSEVDAAGATASMTPAVDKRASTLTGKDQERSSQSLERRAVFKCTSLAAFHTASPIKKLLANRVHDLQGTTSETEGCYSLEGSLFCLNSE